MDKALPAHTVYEIVSKVYIHWDSIPIRVHQDGKWQSLFLSEVKDQGTIAQAIIEWLGPFLAAGDGLGVARPVYPRGQPTPMPAMDDEASS